MIGRDDIEGSKSDVASSVGKASIKDRSPGGRIQGTEGALTPVFATGGSVLMTVSGGEFDWGGTFIKR